MVLGRKPIALEYALICHLSSGQNKNKPQLIPFYNQSANQPPCLEENFNEHLLS